jgi:hypothetical protein
MQAMMVLTGKQEVESTDAALLVEELADIYSPTPRVFGVEPKSCIDDSMIFTMAGGSYLYPRL